MLPKAQVVGVACLGDLQLTVNLTLAACFVYSDPEP